MKTLTFIEIDIDVCALRYGETTAEGTCPAVLGTDSPRKCFNTKVTCPVRPSYVNSPVTLRFAMGTAYLAESGIDAIACIESVSLNPGTISLGEDLGTRSSLSVTLSDFPWPDTGPGYDKYVTERPYDPFKQGSYWGKFRARQPYLRGKPIRIIRGELGQALADMDTRHFVLESFEGPSLDGRYSLIAKDALKMVDEERALAPKLSRGFLVADIDAVVTSATLSPAGIGNIDYPASGWVAIGGKEICEFTRVADVLALTRAQFGTEAAEHKAQDRVQLCLYYNGQDAADIIADQFTTYAGMPPEYIPLAAWQSETGSFLRRVYTRMIPDPTPVKKLVSALIQQAALAVWWDDRARLNRLQVLRQIATDAVAFDESNTLQGSLRIREQPDKRVSQVWTYFGPINPLKKDDDADNYRSSAVTANLEAETDYGAPAVKRIFASWIPAFGRQVALRVNDIQLGRFRTPPRHFTHSSFRGDALVPELGRGYRLQSRPLQDDTGAPDSVPIQITRLQPTDTGFEIESDELRFVSLDGGDLDNRVIIIDANTVDFNFREAHDSLYPEPVSGDEVTCIVEAGVIVGSSNASIPAFDVGSWPAGVTRNLVIRGRIQGKGGNATNGNGGPGGTAIYARYAVAVDATDGEIWGGGGAGGTRVEPSGHSSLVRRWGGAGGQGYMPGLGYVGNEATGPDGTTEAAGNANTGAGDGGAAGQAGQPSTAGTVDTTGGAGGKAIDGVSYLTITGGPDIRGSQIN